ncbi:MAG: hypothetical protein ACTSQE_06780 [Candidatus Heimdallarchaeaceae archaeon]
MTNEQRKKYLEQIAKSPEGVALKGWLEEKIAKLNDASTYPTDSFELEGKASIKASAILKALMFELELLKENKLPKKHNQFE